MVDKKDKAKTIQKGEAPVVASLDPPSEEAPAVFPTELVPATVGVDIQATMDAPKYAGLKISAQLFAKTSGKLHETHRGGFLAWAQEQKLDKATIEEWRMHLQTYRNTRVR